jgi:hypothetical protein
VVYGLYDATTFDWIGRGTRGVQEHITREFSTGLQDLQEKQEGFLDKINRIGAQRRLSGVSRFRLEGLPP